MTSHNQGKQGWVPYGGHFKCFNALFTPTSEYGWGRHLKIQETFVNAFQLYWYSYDIFQYNLSFRSYLKYITIIGINNAS